MFEEAKDLLDGLKGKSIASDPDAFMLEYCRFVAQLALAAGDLANCTPETPYDDSMGERFAAKFSNSAVPFRRFWHTARCSHIVGASIAVLQDQIVPHYGSYEAIPEVYRLRLEASMAEAAAKMPEV